MTNFDIVAGARPNFMKIAPIIHAIHKHNTLEKDLINYRLIHTGQHYDKLMSEAFFEQLGIPEPQINLGAGGGTQAEQTAAIMIGYERCLSDWKPELCIVVGDVTSTMACSIVAKKASIKVAHVEGGIRSGDISMPEEINRIVTDSITDYFFTTSEIANENLKKSGIAAEKIFFVGNTMIDSLLSNLNKLQKAAVFEEQGLDNKKYLVATLHRPANVDSPENLKILLSIIDNHCGGAIVVFPMHPRTRKIFYSLDLLLNNIIVTDPLSYLEFIHLVKNSKGVITDSGGITEETTVLGVPCMTLRDNTERPETITMGTNELVGTDPVNIIPFMHKMAEGNWKKGETPLLWDGKTAERIVRILGGL